MLTDLQGGLGGVGDSFYPGDRRSLHKVSLVNELSIVDLIKTRTQACPNPYRNAKEKLS